MFPGDHTACLWDINEGTPKQVLVFSNHTRSVKTAVFPPNKPSVFATGARDGHILIWDIRASGQPSVVLKPDNCLMSCHSSFTPKTPGSHGKRPRIDHRAISITGLVFQDDLTLLSSGECDGNIKVWDLRKNYNTYKREPLPKHSIPYCGSSTKNGYTNLIVDDARMRLYASCMDNVIYCFNISTYSATPEQRYVGHENSSFYIKTCLSPDCMYLVSGSSDINAYVWNVKYSEPVVKLTGHSAEVTCAAWCQRGDTKIVTCSDDARHKIWRIGREFPEVDAECKGRAEAVPRPDVASLPQWGAPGRTPSSVKRRGASSSCSAKRTRSQAPSARKTKRCLTDLMNATREADEAERMVKRLKLDNLVAVEEEKLLPAGIKRHMASPTKCINDSSDWGYISPKAGTSFMTPTKNYEAKNCKVLSPKGLTNESPNKSSRSPEESSPKFRIISFRTPTKDLPNFVMSGEAPHLRMMSPAKKKLDKPDWLTQLGRDKRWKHTEMGEKTLPEKFVVEKFATEKCVGRFFNGTSPSPSPWLAPAAAPSPRPPPPERAGRGRRGARTLLNYFEVTTKK